jgi:carbonic anhydrase
MKIEDVFKNNEKWIQDKLKLDPDFLKKISEDQNPDSLFRGCSDSRGTAEDMMGVDPVAAFVHRHVANLVISTDLNVMTVLNYAVNQLKVDHVVVCGHYGCGGIKAALQHEDMGILNPWLRNIRDVYRLHKDKLNALDEDQRYKKLVELNVQEQCINVIKTAAVQKASTDRDIKVHGWVFDINTGKLIDLKINFDKILKDIKEIYRLDPITD